MYITKPGLVVHTFNASSQEVGEERSDIQDLTSLATQRVQGPA